MVWCSFSWSIKLVQLKTRWGRQTKPLEVTILKLFSLLTRLVRLVISSKLFWKLSSPGGAKTNRITKSRSSITFSRFAKRTEIHDYLNYHPPYFDNIYAITFVIQSNNTIQSTLDISNSDISNSAKLEASIWMKIYFNCFLHPWFGVGDFFTSPNNPKCKLFALRVIWTCKK